jgi:hypothetical protein
VTDPSGHVRLVRLAIHSKLGQAHRAAASPRDAIRHRAHYRGRCAACLGARAPGGCSSRYQPERIELDEFNAHLVGSSRGCP